VVNVLAFVTDDAEPEAPSTSRTGLTTELIVDPDAKHRLMRRFHLIAEAGPAAGARFTSTGERAVIGSHASCDLVVQDRTVSRFHCEVTLADKQLAVADLGSRNGTVVNGVTIGTARVADGAVLHLGHTRVRCEISSEHIKIPLSPHDRFGRLVGGSAAMRTLYTLLDKAAASDATVLLLGETGTGKELAAESIHEASARASGPCLVLDCGALPAGLLESELFGHEQGAFTGASATRIGIFEAANGGTVFLDEIGELATDLQPKLLRVLEEREVRRVGGSRVIPLDVRVIAATNRNLRAEVNEHRFRSDLYYRLAVVELHMPPLREHKSDLPQLARHLLAQLAEGEVPAELTSKEFLAELANHEWPGNVRELQNHLARCLALKRHVPVERIGQASVEPQVDLQLPYRVARERWLHTFESQYLAGLIRGHAGNVSAAARAAGIDRNYLYRLLWRHGLR